MSGDIVGQKPTSKNTRPDLDMLKDLRREMKDRSKKLGTSKTAMALRPPGEDCSWHAVVEIELTGAAAALAGVKTRVVLICMMQIAVITIAADGTVAWEAWSLVGQQERLGDQLAEAMARMSLQEGA